MEPSAEWRMRAVLLVVMSEGSHQPVDLGEGEVEGGGGGGDGAGRMED